MESVIIQTPTSKIELVEDQINGATICGILRNGVIYVISAEKFNHIIDRAHELGFYVFDYRNFM